MVIKLPRLLPKQEKFFDILKDSARNLLVGAKALKDLVEDYTDVKQKVENIKKIEHRGDNIIHQIMDMLDKTFITPIEREDIHILASELDDVLDAIEGISSRLYNFKIPEPTPECVRLVHIVYQAVEQIEGAMAFLDTTGTRADTKAYKRMRMVLTAAHRSLHNRMHHQGVFHNHTPTDDHPEHH